MLMCVFMCVDGYTMKYWWQLKCDFTLTICNVDFCSVSSVLSNMKNLSYRGLFSKTTRLEVNKKLHDFDI